jgi:peptidoglycan hydrolase-like protein with peptidoglycan-binding domain
MPKSRAIKAPSGAGEDLAILKMGPVDQTRRWRQIGLSSLLCLAAHTLAFAQTASAPAPAHKTKTTAHSTKKHTPSHTTRTTKGSHGKKGSTRKRGQQAIDSTRARQIQAALIREHYMQGEPTGAWDASTQAAMQRYQADQGWQSKTTPDSRALIKLGLGPSSDHLLNPESAMTMPTAPADPKAETKQPQPPR